LVELPLYSRNYIILRKLKIFGSYGVGRIVRGFFLLPGLAKKRRIQLKKSEDFTGVVMNVDVGFLENAGARFASPTQSISDVSEDSSVEQDVREVDEIPNKYEPVAAGKRPMQHVSDDDEESDDEAHRGSDPCFQNGPDLDVYLKCFDMTRADKVALLRAYATYLTSQGPKARRAPYKKHARHEGEEQKSK